MKTDLDEPLVEGLRAVADPVRLQILRLLADSELCVCHLVELLSASQPRVSHHLKALREAGLVESERFRYWTYYRLRPEPLAALGSALTRLAEAAPTAGTARRPCCP